MKAALLYSYGDPEQFRYEETAVPKYGDNEVLVKVRATSINPRAYPAWRVACMKIGAAFRRRSRCGQRFQTRSGGSENSHASSRTSDARGSSDRCAIDPVLLLTLTFLGALGLAGASVRLQSLRPWLLVSAAFLLGIGFIQLYVRRNQCEKRSRLSVALFWGAAVIVVLVILFPQLIASLIAG